MSNTFRINISEPLVPAAEPAPSFIVMLSNGKTLGKYSNGATVPEQASLQEQLEDIGREIINPQLIIPTFSVNLSNVSTQEVGFSYTATMTGNFNQGSILGDLVDEIWQPATEQAKRAGLANNYTLDGTTQSNNSLVVNRTIVLGNNIFNGEVNYLIGPQPLDSNTPRGNYDSPLAPGNLTASKIIQGQFRNFFGFSPNTSLTSAQIIALVNGDLDNNRSRNYTSVTAGVGNYTYYCYPSSYGDLTSIILDGSSPILGAFSKLTNVTITNQHAISETYIIYRSNATNAFTNNALNFS